MGFALCMIVRDGAATLGACLASAERLVDETLVIDTGSRDESREIARAHGATVVEARWQDDFAQARNLYLAKVGYRWILSLDADETVAFSRDQLEALAMGPEEAFVASIRNHICLGDLPWSTRPSTIEQGADGSISIRSRTVRIFLNQPGLAYQYPVHESLLPSLSRLRAPIHETKLAIDHWGFLNTSMSRRLQRYGALGRKKLAAHPRSIIAHIEAGKLMLDNGEFRDSACCFAALAKARPEIPALAYYECLGLLLAGLDMPFRLRLDAARRTFRGDPDLQTLVSLATTPRSELRPQMLVPGAAPA